MDLYLLLALLSGGLVGLLLGATGGGGSLVAIPLLVYVVGRCLGPGRKTVINGSTSLLPLCLV